jgi:hypothetical protein
VSAATPRGTVHVKAGVDERAAAFEARLAGRARDEDLVAHEKNRARAVLEDFREESNVYVQAQAGGGKLRADGEALLQRGVQCILITERTPQPTLFRQPAL